MLCRHSLVRTLPGPIVPTVPRPAYTVICPTYPNTSTRVAPTQTKRGSHAPLVHRTPEPEPGRTPHHDQPKCDWAARHQANSARDGSDGHEPMCNQISLWRSHPADLSESLASLEPPHTFRVSLLVSARVYLFRRGAGSVSPVGARGSDSGRALDHLPLECLPGSIRWGRPWQAGEDHLASSVPPSSLPTTLPNALRPCA